MGGDESVYVPEKLPRCGRVSARDPDLAPEPISYTWSSSAGTFTNGNTATPTFRCAQAGAATITVQVSDGQCTKTDTVSLSCVAGGAGVDGGFASISCTQSDAVYESALRDDPILAQLASCSVDTDCANYDPTAHCANGGVHSGCFGTTHRSNVVQAEARKDVIAAATYCAPGAPRCINFGSCVVNTFLRCVEGRCTKRVEPPDAGL
ncbi:MAG: hypothetical protein RLZZ450_7694 [Pseudomonadota bacterium]|jgi:hypothetical protein